MSVRAIDRRFMHMIAYFLVMNSKRCNMPLAFFCLVAFSRSGPVTVRCSSVFSLISQCDIICVKIGIRKTGLAERLLLDFGWATSGDINPNPGPSITWFTTNHFRQRHEMQRRRNPCNLVQIKCESDLHLRTSTTNLTMSGLEVKSGITDRVWPINTVES